MNNNIKKSEIARQQMILNNAVNCFNIQNTPILELSRKIDRLIIDYYNETNEKLVNDEEGH